MSSKIIQHLAFKHFSLDASSTIPIQIQLESDSIKTVKVLCLTCKTDDISDSIIVKTNELMHDVHTPSDAITNLNQNQNLECTKTINIETTIRPKATNTSRHIIQPKQFKKRVVTTHKNWNDIDKQLHAQFDLISNINDINNTVQRELKKKIASYKSQDHHKNIYSYEHFIDFNFVVNLLQKSELKCYYCKNITLLMYDNVREPKQWTIERIDNKFGHNKDNSVIACLDCNLKRRTLYHEKYLQTKQLCRALQDR